MSEKIKKVAVIMGGLSGEREISLASGKGVAEALKSRGYDVAEIDLTPDIAAFVNALTSFKPDAVFNALHGRYGEDGAVQGLLNLLNIPYTHSGVLASSVGMDKEQTRKVARSIGVPVANGGLKTKEEMLTNPPQIPYVAKPNDDGSSLGVVIVKNEAEHEALMQNWGENQTLLVEDYIAGRELSVAVLGDEVLGDVELVPESGFYDYTNKYTDGKTKHLVPAPLPPEQSALMAKYALAVHQALGCRGVSRSDFRYDDTNPENPRLVFLEINTNPGMTPFSLVPDIAKSKKIAYDELVSKLVEAAQCD